MTDMKSELVSASSILVSYHFPFFSCFPLFTLGQTRLSHASNILNYISPFKTCKLQNSLSKSHVMIGEFGWLLDQLKTFRILEQVIHGTLIQKLKLYLDFSFTLFWITLLHSMSNLYDGSCLSSMFNTQDLPIWGIRLSYFPFLVNFCDCRMASFFVEHNQCDVAVLHHLVSWWSLV